MAETYTSTYTSTFTEARARAVAKKVLDDLLGLAVGKYIKPETALEWYDDLVYCMSKQALKSFELQFVKPTGERLGIRYIVFDDGSYAEDDPSGGLDFHSLPTGTASALVISLDYDRRGIDDVKAHLSRRGWTWSGKLLEGQGQKDRVLSNNGYGVVRQKVGF